MSIPKIIHYCWFGGGTISPENRKCMESWKKYCPDYKIIEWNEQNFDVSQSLYTRQAYDARRWAFVADYARLKILYEQGGIYMDTDVELLRPLDDASVLRPHEAVSAPEHLQRTHRVERRRQMCEPLLLLRDCPLHQRREHPALVVEQHPPIL
mgnify:CR=1 FL=1